MPWRCGMMLRLQFNNRVALSSCNRRVIYSFIIRTLFIHRGHTHHLAALQQIQHYLVTIPNSVIVPHSTFLFRAGDGCESCRN